MNLQVKSEDGRLSLKVGPRRATLTMEGKKVVGFDVLRIEDLTAGTARELEAEQEGRLVVYRRSSPEARTILRKRGIPFVGEDGEVYIHEPPVHVELPRRRKAAALNPVQRPAPFAPKASRISRWFLLNPNAEPTFRHLSAMLELSEAVVSRSIAALADERLVEVEVHPRDARARRARVRDTGALLDAFERSTRRRVRSSTWDIGARDVEKALKRVRTAAKRGGLTYAVGGLTGASLLRPVVEPTEVDLWANRADFATWVDLLAPLPSRRGPGRLTVNAIPDPFVLLLAARKKGVLVADPVQLYLDCRRSGERALEAAEAIRSEMGW